MKSAQKYPIPTKFLFNLDSKDHKIIEYGIGLVAGARIGKVFFGGSVITERLYLCIETLNRV